MANLNICSLNVRGLRNKIKRKTLFYKFSKERYDIICLQETYITHNDIIQWELEWGGKIFYSTATNHSKGQVILVRKHFPYEVNCTLSTQRIVAIEVHLEENNLHIVNVYGPNAEDEKAAFFRDVYICKENSNNEIICGDFNCVLDNNLDIISGRKHNAKDVELFNKTVIDSNLNDVWRLSHAEEKDFTWSTKFPFIARRLDYMLASDFALNKCYECENISMAHTDHRLIRLKYCISPVERGPSFWKFNDNHLNDPDFVIKMNSLIENYVIETDNMDPQIRWDLCKIKIREFCIAYGKEKKRKLISERSLLTKELNETDKKLASNPYDVHLMTHRGQVKQNLELHELNEAKSAQKRSKEKYIAEGEKNTRYFLGLEKMRANMKIMDKLQTAEGNTVTAQSDILQEQVKFYKNVFKKTDDFSEAQANTFLGEADIPQLTREQTEALENPVTEQELLKALKSMKNGSSPGCDGVTTSFIKFFWSRIRELLLGSIQRSFHVGEMSPSQKRAIITLIHKGKDLTRDNLCNWRPISLTNTDYKLLAKCLALRMSNVISDLISEDQVGFIKGRKASNIIRLIDDVIEHMNNENKPGILLALDYTRAFDSISKEFMLWAFRKFGFGENFTHWVKVLTNETESSINYLGWISEPFPIETGIRQGCPFSPMAFILGLEILAIKIRNDPSIHGLRLPRSQIETNNSIDMIKLAMYADDISMLLQGKQDLENAMKLVTDFTKISQLKINKNKTEAMWLGSQKDSREHLCDLKWKKQLKILGILFKNDVTASDINENWSVRIEKIERIISIWSKRNLSITGKLCIVKSFLISQFVYPMQALSAPATILQKVNTILFRFLWKKKYTNTRAFEKVKRCVMCNVGENGGCNMINIIDMQASFMMTWITQLKIDTSAKWKLIPTYIFNEVGTNLCCLNATANPKTFLGLEKVKSKFWKSCLIKWLEFRNIYLSNTEFKYTCLWNSKEIMYRNRPLFFKRWTNAYINYVQDIWTDEGLLPLARIAEKIGDYPALLFDYNAMRTALIAQSLRADNNQTQEATVSLEPQSLKNWTPKKFRSLLTKQKANTPCSIHFWMNKYNYKIERNHWMIANNCTKEERLRLLHWKILHNIYPTNILLHKMKKRENNRCSLCGDIDFIEHFFFKCPRISLFWKNVEKQIYIKTGSQIKLKETDVLFGFQPNKQQDQTIRNINFILLVAKMSISIYKYGEGFDPNCIFERELSIRLFD